MKYLNKLLGVVLMYIALMILVLMASGSFSYVEGNALFHASLVSIMLFFGVVFFGVVASLAVFYLGYSFFRK